jgi:hypothetical protein
MEKFQPTTAFCSLLKGNPVNHYHGIMLVDYVNQIIAFFIKVQNMRTSLTKFDEVRPELLPWQYIERVKKDTPLPIPSEYFAIKAPRQFSRVVTLELDEIVTILNSTEDIVVWKRGMNRLYRILLPNQISRFYLGENCNPDLSLEEPNDN